MESVLLPLIRNEVIEGFDISLPILVSLDKDPASLTAAELAQINNAQSHRVVEVMIEYADPGRGSSPTARQAHPGRRVARLFVSPLLTRSTKGVSVAFSF